MRRALCIGLLATLAAVGCNDDELTTLGTGGTAGKGGGGGSGGMGAVGGEGGSGADGGGGAGPGGGGSGGSGGDPCTDWACQCPSGCQKLSDCNNGADICGDILATDCGGTPPAQPFQCIVECVHEHIPAGNCSDYDNWFQPTTKPTPAFAQCIAACPGTAGNVAIGMAPVHGVLFSTIANPPPPPGCAQQFCSTELNACIGDAGCTDWAVFCYGECSDVDRLTAGNYGSTAACWQECTAAHGQTGAGGAGGSAPNAAVDALVGCLCNAQTTQVGMGTAVYDWFGTADCSDVLKGHMDACSI